MSISQMKTARGNAWAKQLIIEEGDTRRLQSYSDIVASFTVDDLTGAATLVLGRNWDFSRTTMKAVVRFLSYYCGIGQLADATAIRRAIKRGATERDGETVAVSLDKKLV